MASSSMSAALLLEEQLPLIEDVLRGLGARQRLDAGEREDLHSYAMMRLWDSDCRVLRSFSGLSSRRTYLTVVAHRFLLDYRTKKWGKWRPCAQSRRLGTMATELDRLINRDQMSPAEAVRWVHQRTPGASRAELESCATSLPLRQRPKNIGEDCLNLLPAPQRSDRRAGDPEQANQARTLARSLASALGDLKAEDRLLLELRFSGQTVSSLADKLDIGTQQLYRRIYSCLRVLRRSLEARGIHRAMVSSVVDLNDALARVNERAAESRGALGARS